MPSTSVAQQHFFGAIKGGAIPKPKGMSDQTVHDFAATPTKGLPQHVRKYYADGQLSDAFDSNKGGLHRATHTPKGQTIPASKVIAASHSDDIHKKRMAQAAINMNPRHYYGSK